MKLISYLQSIREESDKRKLLSMHLLTIDKKVKKISIESVTKRFGIISRHLLTFVKQLPEIEVDGYLIQFEVNGVWLNVSRKKIRKGLTQKQKSFIENVLGTLNEITGKGYRTSSKKNQTTILARISEGYTYENFVHVIHGQAIRWLGTESELYLRPETLFGSKMDGYLNMPIPKSKSTNNKLHKINEAINSAKQFDWEANS